MSSSAPDARRRSPVAARSRRPDVVRLITDALKEQAWVASRPALWVLIAWMTEPAGACDVHRRQSLPAAHVERRQQLYREREVLLEVVSRRDRGGLRRGNEAVGEGLKV